MGRDVVVTVENVSKRFKLYRDVVFDPLKEYIFFWRSEEFYREFWAVRNVSLEIRKGEIVGIIGANGAGKSTLLKMIAGLLKIDEGTIEIKGKVTALLTLGLGFHSEFTGRENILYGGMLLGMSKQEVLSKVESIIEFAEIGDYIDRPLRTYSSGMKARLVFATSMSVNPEILLVDEALATGDSYFVSKCAQKIRDLCNSGATILFVSHNLRQIEDLCPRAVVMHEGGVLFDGETNEAVSRYVESVHRHRATHIGGAGTTEDGHKPYRGTGEIRIEDFYFICDAQRSETLKIGKPCELHIDFEASQDIEEVTLCVELFSEKSPITFAFFPYYACFVEGQTRSTFTVKAGKGKIVIHISKVILGDGIYRCSAEFYPGRESYFFSYDTCYCFYNRAWSFQAVYEDPKFFGRGTLAEIPIMSVEMRNR
jgi:ABC-type polysaccharide/polyol phosphate transport system ATPase subunit